MPYTLLLADDSVTIQRVIELTFADEDVHVIAVSDGDQAIARIEASPPDIILADIGMPGKNGYEVAQYVKQSPRLAHIPVVLLTGAFEPVDQARATAAGCEGVLAKPFEPQLVIGRVKELLGKARAGAVAEPSPMPPPAPDPAPDAWSSSPVADQIFAAPAAAPPAAGIDLNNYFDRLDQAFANLSSPAPAAAPAATLPAPQSDDADWFGTLKTPAQAPPPDSWDIAAPPLARSDLPLSYPSALPDFDQLPLAPKPLELDEPVRQQFEPAPFEPVPVDITPAAPLEPPPPAASSPATPFDHAPFDHAQGRQGRPAVQTAAAAALPPIADAFAAMLAAEQGSAQPSAAPEWPAASPTAAAITDDLVEEVARRVLARLSDATVRETVSELVSAIAERLVREEIERIKASIR